MKQRPYHELTTRGQLQRLRPLAMRALAQHEIEVHQIRPLQHGENTTYDVRGRRTGKVGRFLLRIHRHGYQDFSSICAELDWLAALNQETDLIVPEPIPGGGTPTPLSAIQVPGVPHMRHVALFHWIKARHRRVFLPIHLQRLGTVTATLHEHSAKTTSNRGSLRHAWDTQGLVGSPTLWGDPFAAPLSEEQRAVLRDAIVRVRDELKPLETNPKLFMLIHADLHPGNVLFAEHRAVAIDFDDCGRGFLPYDTAVSIGRMRNRADWPALWAAYWRGYQAVRSPPPGYLEALDACLMARRILNLAWIMSRSATNPNLRQHIDRIIPDVDQVARQYLSGTPLLPSEIP